MRRMILLLTYIFDCSHQEIWLEFVNKVICYTSYFVLSLSSGKRLSAKFNIEKCGFSIEYKGISTEIGMSIVPTDDRCGKLHI